MTSREQLANYQAELLEALSSAATPEEASDRLRELAKSAEMQEQVGTLDPRMMDVAMRLTKKWGCRIQ